MTSVSVIIKALNEELHIAGAIESTLAALARIGGGEVVVADGGSTDATVAIASRYPVKLVQLERRQDARCGAGPQLGFQHARGRYICLIDGDMELAPGFLPAALDALATNAALAGVSGQVEERNLESLEYVRRTRRQPADMRAGEVDRLNGGGLYRRQAIEAAGYLSDRNLHGHEEFDLAVRLRAMGWRLQRLPVPFVGHHGHTTGAYKLLLRRWRSRYLAGSGEVLRASLGRPHFAATLRGLPEIRLWVAVIGSWLVAAGWLTAAPGIGSAAVGLAAVMLGPVALMSWRTGSVGIGTYSVVAWHLHSLGFLFGLLRPRIAPAEPLASRVLQSEGGERMERRSAHVTR